jgi:transcriptional regulator with XRE-family HTH domain
MKYNEKLGSFFKSKKLSQKKVAEKLGFSGAMISRYISGVSVFPAAFLTALLKQFPDIDLHYIFMEEETHEVNAVEESTPNYELSNEDVVEELQLIENRIAKVREVLERNKK